MQEILVTYDIGFNMRRNWFYFIGHGLILTVSILSIYVDSIRYGWPVLIFSALAAIGIGLITLKIVQLDALVDSASDDSRIIEELRFDELSTKKTISKLQWLRLGFMIVQFYGIEWLLT